MFKAKELMNADVIAVGPSDTVDDAMTLMQRHKISGLAVIDEAGSLLGVVSEYDLLGLVWITRHDLICRILSVRNRMRQELSRTQPANG